MEHTPFTPLGSIAALLRPTIRVESAYKSQITNFDFLLSVVPLVLETDGGLVSALNTKVNGDNAPGFDLVAVTTPPA